MGSMSGNQLGGALYCLVNYSRENRWLEPQLFGKIIKEYQMFTITIHQIFSLGRDWSKHVT